MDIANPLEYVGCRWILETKCGGTIEGFLKDYYAGNGCLVFHDAELKRSLETKPTEDRGFLAIFACDVLKTTIINESQDAKEHQGLNVQLATQEFADEKRSNMKEDCITVENNDKPQCSVAQTNILLSNSLDNDITLLFDSRVCDPNVVWNVRIEDWKVPCSSIIDYLDSHEKINSAMADIKDMDIIGLACLGSDLSRRGSIECLLVSTNSKNYVFFDDKWNCDSMVKILESNVKKVVHGSAFLADVLLNKYKIKLNAVEDTQIYDFCLRRHGNKPLQLRNYRQCLFDYLNIEILDIFSRKNFEFVKRYLFSKTFESFVRIRVMPLRQLQVTLLSKILENISLGTEMYIKSYVETNDVEFESLLNLTNSCPLLSKRRTELPNTFNTEDGRIERKKISCRILNEYEKIDLRRLSLGNQVIDNKIELMQQRNRFRRKTDSKAKIKQLSSRPHVTECTSSHLSVTEAKDVEIILISSDSEEDAVTELCAKTSKIMEQSST